jgi:DNA-directed RNA polymerase subunit K/omega
MSNKPEDDEMPIDDGSDNESGDDEMPIDNSDTEGDDNNEEDEEDDEERNKETVLDGDDDNEEDDNEEDDNEDDDNEEDDNEDNDNNDEPIKNTEYAGNVSSDSEDDDDDDDEDYLQKIDSEMSSDIILKNHHELKSHNTSEIEIMCKVIRNTNGTIIDPLHTTVPFITRYEKTRIIGERAVQIESGATPFVEIKENIIDAYLIAKMEYDAKKIPYIIRRPLPNGGSEYWKFADLEQLD